MSKLIAVIAAGLFAAGTMFAGPNPCEEKVASCKASLANFNLEANKKRLFNQALDNYQKNGCPPNGQSAIKQFAGAALTPEQFATFKVECKVI
jgi:hypothetical protein